MQEPSGPGRSLSRAQFVRLARSSLGRGSRHHFGLLFDSVVSCQGGGGGPPGEEVCISWRSLCSFLLLQLSDRLKRSRKGSVPSWERPRELACPHREPVQKVNGTPERGGGVASR